MVSEVTSAAGSKQFRFLTCFFVSVLLHSSDPQTDRDTAQQHGSHSDWLTLNIGGRPFTTTRYLLLTI